MYRKVDSRRKGLTTTRRLVERKTSRRGLCARSSRGIECQMSIDDDSTRPARDLVLRRGLKFLPSERKNSIEREKERERERESVGICVCVCVCVCVRVVNS